MVFTNLQNSGHIEPYQAVKNGKSYFYYIVNNKIKHANIDNDFELIFKDGENEYIYENFNNMKIRIFNSEIGKVIPLADVYKSLGIDRKLFYAYINANKILLSQSLIKLNIENSNQICLTRDGIIEVLLKLNYSLFGEDKKQLIIEFQIWIIEKLGESIPIEKVEKINKETIKIQENIIKTTELDEDEVDTLFNNIECSLSKVTFMFESLKLITKKRKEEVQQIEYDNTVLKTINDKYRTKTVQLQERINELKWS